jgi:secreted trypsin-like serine protease
MSADWAPEVSADPTDDAVPVDSELDPSGLGWEVVPVAPSGGQARTVAVADVAGRAEIFQMRPRTSGSARPSTGTTGARPARGTDDGGKDTAYSFGGQPIKPGFAPWQAQIYRSAAREAPGVPRWKAQHNCGGTLIAPGWILTAAHCIDDILDDREAGWRVRLGGQDLSKEDGVTYAVERWVRHSGYKNVAHPDPPKSPLPPPNMYANDIGLIRIKADAQTRPLADPKRVQPITFYRKPIKGGDEVTAIGWGMTQNAAKSFSAVPLKVDLQVMDTPVCQARRGYGPERVNAGVICAAREGQKTCRGDSGGPVILTNGTTAQLVGLVSWGKRDCAGDGRPSVFTRLESHLGWIEQAMKLPETRASLP